MNLSSDLLGQILIELDLEITGYQAQIEMTQFLLDQTDYCMTKDEKQLHISAKSRLRRLKKLRQQIVNEAVSE